MTVPAVIFLVLFAAAVAACAAVYVRMSSAARSLQVKLAYAEAARDAVLREADAVRGDAQRYLEDKISAEKKLSASEEKISSLVSKLESRAEEEKRLREKLTADFEILSNKIFEATREKISAANLEQIGLILAPLKNNIKDFRERIDALNETGTRNSASLEKHIESLVKMNTRLSEDAQNLTSALKSNNKAAGNWGEVVLQRIFESCGFKEGVHFRSQESYADASGEQKRLVPDFILDLPGGRSIIVDSKLSLVSFADYVSAKDDAARREALREFKNSVRAHLKGFADKYNALDDVNMGFKVMFMPVEPAYELIVSEDGRLLADAYEKNVLIVGPSTIMSVLKFAEISFRNSAVEKNAREIAEIGNELYRRVTRFLERFGKVGTRISQAKEDYDAALKTLSEGRQSVMSAAKRLGAKSSGEILELDEDEQR